MSSLKKEKCLVPYKSFKAGRENLLKYNSNAIGKDLESCLLQPYFRSVYRFGINNVYYDSTPQLPFDQLLITKSKFKNHNAGCLFHISKKLSQYY